MDFTPSLLRNWIFQPPLLRPLASSPLPFKTSTPVIHVAFSSQIGYPNHSRSSSTCEVYFASAHLKCTSHRHFHLSPITALHLQPPSPTPLSASHTQLSSSASSRNIGCPSLRPSPTLRPCLLCPPPPNITCYFFPPTSTLHFSSPLPPPSSFLCGTGEYFHDGGGRVATDVLLPVALLVES